MIDYLVNMTWQDLNELFKFIWALIVIVFLSACFIWALLPESAVSWLWQDETESDRENDI